jgi:hypothetical protein
LQWPVPAGGNEQYAPLLVRMIRQSPDEPASALARHFLDFGIYLVTLIGIGLMLVAWKRNLRNTLIGLMAIGLLGIAYTSGMFPYIGPVVGICGFTLIFFGGMVAWIAPSLKQPDPATGSEDEAAQIRTDDHASIHFVA